MSEKKIEWFGADVETDGAQVTAVLDGFNGVDADVPKTVQGDDGLKRILVRKPAPKSGSMRVRTTAKDADIARLTARYKLMRSAFQFSPVADKDQAERHMQIAFHEMQVERFRQKLAAYEANPLRAGDPEVRPEQVKVYKRKIAEHRGEVLELMGE